jgi:beta-glucosidase
MEGNYASTTSFVSTVIEALSEELAALGGGFTLAFVQGSNAVTPLDNGLAEAAAAAAAADLVILAVGLGCQVEAEGLDRSYLTLPPPQQQLLAAVSLALPAASRLVLLSVSAGVIDLDEELADAWVSMGYPGEEAGHGLMDVLFGRVSPSGRLPLTGYADEYLAVCGPTADFNMVSSSTGVGRTYRFAHRIPQGMVKLMFGTGLSYSTFAYSAPAASFNSSAGAVTVTALLENTGAFPGASQVTQVYVAPPQVQGLVTPLRSLAAFTISQPGGPGQGEALAFTLAYPGAFYVTLADGSRQVSGGVYSIFVGGHQPGDARGDRVANVLQVNVTLPASALLPPPFPA